MTNETNELLRTLTPSSASKERCIVSDALLDEGRVLEASLLRADGPVAIRHAGARWWIEQRPRPLARWRGCHLVDHFAERSDVAAVEWQRWGKDWQVFSAYPSLRLRAHSPEGFEWGYSGSGPAQLALAILLRVVRPESALVYYQHFKSAVIAALPRDGWTITEEDVLRWWDDTSEQAASEKSIRR